MSFKKEHSKGLEEKVKRLKQANHALREHLKAKDEEIERIYSENKKLMEYITLKKISEPIVFCAKCASEIILKDHACGS